MLRDKNATREFEASLSYEVKRLKIAVLILILMEHAQRDNFKLTMAMA